MHNILHKIKAAEDLTKELKEIYEKSASEFMESYEELSQVVDMLRRCSGAPYNSMMTDISTKTIGLRFKAEDMSYKHLYHDQQDKAENYLKKGSSLFSEELEVFNKVVKDSELACENSKELLKAYADDY